MTTPIVLDTDIGTDVDDCLALAVVLASPEVELLGVTCVYGDVDLRAQMVRKLLELHGRPDVPVRVGAREPLLGLQPVYWAGHEGQGLVAPGEVRPSDGEHAVDFLSHTVHERPGQVYVLAIGPLTNIALALMKEPALAGQLAGITIMGGAIRCAGRFDLPYSEHNIRCDPEAAHVVFRSGAPIVQVPLDVTTRVQITSRGVERIRSGGTPFHTAVADQVAAYPPFQARGYTHLHDPLAAAIVIAPELVELTNLHIDVELGGRHTTGATLARTPSSAAPANARVALAVDAPRAEAWLLDLLSTPNPGRSG